VSAAFERIAVVGLGLLGGSVALAARARGVAKRVVGSTRSEKARAEALAGGAVDAIVPLESAGAEADLVVLATPVHAMPQVLRTLAPSLLEGAVVTDVGSVKAPLAETLPGLLPAHATYVGSHPMAGSHERGMSSARSDLLEGAACIVSVGDRPEAEDRVCAFWQALGARVVRRDPLRHDEEVAWVSHLPHALAFAFGKAYGAAPASAAEITGSGFRDFTRIARSDLELWGDILTANGKALDGPLQQAADALAELARIIASGDADALEQWLQPARHALALAPAQPAHENQDETSRPPDGATQNGDPNESNE
jgi:prephenate dehydrogenase